MIEEHGGQYSNMVIMYFNYENIVDVSNKTHEYYYSLRYYGSSVYRYTSIYLTKKDDNYLKSIKMSVNIIDKCVNMYFMDKNGIVIESKSSKEAYNHMPKEFVCVVSIPYSGFRKTVTLVE